MFQQVHAVQLGRLAGLVFAAFEQAYADGDMDIAMRLLKTLENCVGLASTRAQRASTIDVLVDAHRRLLVQRDDTHCAVMSEESAGVPSEWRAPRKH